MSVFLFFSVELHAIRINSNRESNKLNQGRGTRLSLNFDHCVFHSIFCSEKILHALIWNFHYYFEFQIDLNIIYILHQNNNNITKNTFQKLFHAIHLSHSFACAVTLISNCIKIDILLLIASNANPNDNQIISHEHKARWNFPVLSY